MEEESLPEKIKDMAAFGLGISLILAGALAIGVIAIPASLAYRSYNYIRGNQLYVRKPEQIKLPKELATRLRGGGLTGKLEIRLEPLAKPAWEFGAHRGYEVNSVNNGQSDRLAAVVVNGENWNEFSFPNEGWIYEVGAVFPNDKFVKIDYGSGVGIEDLVTAQVLGAMYDSNIGLMVAEHYAHRTAVAIAGQIGNLTNIPVEDRSKQDRADLLRKLYPSPLYN